LGVAALRTYDSGLSTAIDVAKPETGGTTYCIHATVGSHSAIVNGPGGTVQTDAGTCAWPPAASPPPTGRNSDTMWRRRRGRRLRCVRREFLARRLQSSGAFKAPAATWAVGSGSRSRERSRSV